MISWLTNAASSALRGGQWLGQKVIRPGLNWLKSNSPTLGPVIQAAEPLIETAGDVWNRGADAVDRVKRGEPANFKLPPEQKLKTAADSAIDTFKKLKKMRTGV